MRNWRLHNVGDFAATLRSHPRLNIRLLAEIESFGQDDAFVSYEGEAEGAMRNGTRVVKTYSEPQDTHEPGALATITGSLPRIELLETPYALDPGEFMYFVRWDDLPDMPVACRGKKLAPVKP
jgi:hypothetical protein